MRSGGRCESDESALKAKIAAGTDISAMENEVFSHLTKFFSRYYDGGDFISKRRYKDDTYAIHIVVREVEVVLSKCRSIHIRTSGISRNYSFVLLHYRHRFTSLRDAETEQNNNKTANNMERRFAFARTTL